MIRFLAYQNAERFNFKYDRTFTYKKNCTLVKYK